MGAQANVAISPAPVVRAPAGYSLYQRVTITNGVGGATLVSLLSGGVLPAIPVPNRQDGANYSFGYVDLQPETDPLTVTVRYTDDGQTVPTATLGFVVGYGLQGGWTRIPANPNDIKLISAGANVNIQVRLGIMGTT